MSESAKPQERSIAKLSPVATAPPSGTVLDRAADAVLVTAASRIRRPGSAIVIGGQFVARFSTPRAVKRATWAGVIAAKAAWVVSAPARSSSR